MYSRYFDVLSNFKQNEYNIQFDTKIIQDRVCRRILKLRIHKFLIIHILYDIHAPDCVIILPGGGAV